MVRLLLLSSHFDPLSASSAVFFLKSFYSARNQMLLLRELMDDTELERETLRNCGGMAASNSLLAQI
eukprot:m.45642 g.45642  ORF g.45642 m.45642 type:complete len:67 (+) comp12192_c1_seq1:694-894(+)